MTTAKSATDIPRRTGLYVGDALRVALPGLGPAKESVSGRIDRMAAQYTELLATNAPKLTAAEWDVIKRYANIGLTDPDMLWADIEKVARRRQDDSDTADDGLSAEALHLFSETLRTMPLAGRLAIIKHFYLEQNGCAVENA